MGDLPGDGWPGLQGCVHVKILLLFASGQVAVCHITVTYAPPSLFLTHPHCHAPHATIIVHLHHCVPCALTSPLGPSHPHLLCPMCSHLSHRMCTVSSPIMPHAPSPIMPHVPSPIMPHAPPPSHPTHPYCHIHHALTAACPLHCVCPYSMWLCKPWLYQVGWCHCGEM